MVEVTMDGATSPVRSLDSLPFEILNLIVRQLGCTTDLKNLRQTCKTIATIVSPELFSTVIMMPDAESIDKMRQLLESPDLTGLVRRVVYYIKELTAEDDELEDYDELRHFWLVQKRKDLLLFKFRNVSEVEFRFEEFLLPPIRDDWLDDEDFIKYANGWMRRLVSSVHANVTSVTSLTVTKIPAYPLCITHNPRTKFKPLMRRLQELHLSIDSMAYTQRRVHVGAIKFTDHLCKEWISLCSAQLTSLSIHMTCYWGIETMPSIEELRLPNLRQLTLWKYVFAYKSQFEWILQHTTLESLSLIACPIVVHIEIDGQSDCKSGHIFDRNRFQGNITPTTSETHVWSNSMRWTAWLARIGTDLVHLKNFQFCGGHGHELVHNWTLEADQIIFVGNEAYDEDIYCPHLLDQPGEVMDMDAEQRPLSTDYMPVVSDRYMHI
jgi:hypothetical protein